MDISLDDILNTLQKQADADWALLSDTDKIIGGKTEPTQAECHTDTQQ